ncbi:MAG: EAL domain-containing protein [Sulfuritalea sp.]|nr:EAL domain-containing protein [Sulfuritalea sp.]
MIAALRWLVLTCCLLFSSGTLLAADQALRIGVLAFRGQERALAEWQAHADFLTEKLAPHRFSIVPLTLAEFGPAIDSRRIDLVITNTGNYVELESGGKISRIATMRVAGPQGPVDRFGGVAIALAARTDLNTYADLRGKRVAVPNVHGFGGWQVHLREARAVGLDLTHDLGRIIELQAQDKVVESVLAGQADAGFVRSDLVESMAAAGKLDLARLRVIGARQTPNFPYWHSTQLYPHWAFARLDHVSEELARDLLIALLSMRPEHPAAVAAKIYGWTLPQNYQAVHDLFLEFRLGPYADLPVALGDIMTRYGKPIVLGGAIFIALLLAALWAIARSNGILRRSQDRLQLAAGVFSHAQEGILITDPEGDIVDANDTFLALTGYRRDEVLGQNPRILASGRHSIEFYRELWQSLLDKGVWRGELVNKRKDGTLYVQQTSISAVVDAQGKTRHYIGLSSDITVLKESQDRLEQMAYFDALTGLPNRRMLSDRLQQAIARAQRAEDLLAVCYLDLDDFKPVNDTLGHAAGDRLLIEAAQRLLSGVRAGDTVSRLGGDEFVVLLGNLANFDECEGALARIRGAINKPFLLKEGEARVSVSMGVTLYPMDGADADTLIRHADQAMYQAKQAGRNCYVLFDGEHDLMADIRREANKSILDAIAKDQLRLYFQPRVNMRNGEVVGAEALIRWQHPERGRLDPAEFLPMVDLVRLHGPIGDWVLDTALGLAEEWAKAGLDLTISVNIAADQLQTTDFVERLREVLARHPGASPRKIELEILETAALHDLSKASRVIEACTALGVSFTVDDFGTGYSSLSYLKQVQAGTLKIDQSFVHDMLEDPDDLAIVDSIVGLASAFRRRVVAEGVETVRHGRLLLELGCELAQGYCISRPMPAADLPAWIAGWQQPAEWKQVPLLPRQDLPLLTVEVDHLRWIQLLGDSIKASPDQAPASPPLDPHNCRFGHWLDNLGHDRYGHFPEFPQLVRAHEAVHAAGRQIHQLAHEDPAAAREQLPVLEERRDELLRALAQLRREVPNHGAERAYHGG